MILLVFYGRRHVRPTDPNDFKIRFHRYRVAVPDKDRYIISRCTTLYQDQFSGRVAQYKGGCVAAQFFSERNLAFLLHEVFDAEALTGYEYYREHHRKTFDMVIKAASKLAKNLLYPIFTEMDRKPPEWVDGTVKVHPLVPKILKEFGNGGWITSRVPFDRDG